MPVRSDEQQSIFIDEFMYYFMRLRKCHCRHIVGRLKRKYPSASASILAERLVNSQALLSFSAGGLLNLPSEIIPDNKSLRIIGIAGGSVVLTRLHIELILKIALIFGKNIDDRERVPEILAVIAATVPLLMLSGTRRKDNSSSSASGLQVFAVSGILGAAGTYLLGRTAIWYYSRSNL